MAEKNNRKKLKHRGKGSATAGTSASAAPASTTPITSFFSRQPPSKLPCPLCGQLVPRFKINEHIDLQCLNFDRGDSSIAASADRSVVPSMQLSPRRSSTKSPEWDRSRGEEVEENQTSPYFKKNNLQQGPQEIKNKTVVRTLDLGRLSSKLSRRFKTAEEKTQTDLEDAETHLKKEADTSETLGSSQKENVLLQSSEDQMSATVCDKSTASPETAVGRELNSEQGHEPKQKGLTQNIFQMQDNPKLHSPSSKLTKRKQEKSFNGKEYESSKKAKFDRRMKMDEVLPKINDTNKTETAELLTTAREPSLTQDEIHDISAAVLKSDSLPEFSQQTTSDHSAESINTQRLPYYLNNFHTVLQAVLENEDDKALFNEEDMSFVHAFEKLSVPGQKLYVRLFQRKLKWLQVNKLDYGEICSDLTPVVEELVQSGLLQTENDLEDLVEALDLLPAPDLKALAKIFHLSSSGTQKQQLVKGLLHLSKQKSFFSLGAAQNTRTVILKRAKQFAGSCVRLCRGPRVVFSRILLLFSLTDTMEEEEMAAGGQSQLYTILLVNSGRLAFPDYKVQREAKVFQGREDLIRYEAAMRSLQDVTIAMQAGQWEEALELYTVSKNVWKELKENHDYSHEKELPVYLRSFTTGWSYTRLLSRGVEILQRLRKYEEAVVELQALLCQSEYCLDSRGRWWDRLALNLQQHLKKAEQAIHAIKDGLSDPLVRTGTKLSLHQRAVRMKESASFKKYRLKLKDLPTIHVQDVKHVTIRGQLFPHEGGMGKSRFLLQANNEGLAGSNTTVICSVEELSLAHYRQQGFDQGIHGEGSTFSTLFGLLLWDIIFMEGIPDVFRNPFQTCPLDLYTDCFYKNRKDAIDSRIQLLSEASVETLHSMLEEVWTSQQGKVCSLVNWELFSSLQHAQSLVSCLGGGFTGGVIARMSKDYRHCRGGLPDLVVWNTTENTYKLVEVKGPNDRLSQKQQIWLDELQKLGADVEVCHVVASGARGAHLD
ncbi:fanconi-associated nuclease 1 [Cynoglossus semilaevis]|uniref:Fanconi-associated nuclease n=1 Tax=Cynoglossus semilaevis TaxID=244447 RepID=A0A3P8W105_CYNSE|nr:fanconi-associated nuclease 1 [Cynoglossus semilaevis]